MYYFNLQKKIDIYTEARTLFHGMKVYIEGYEAIPDLSHPPP